jgi:hypothetical protein
MALLEGSLISFGDQGKQACRHNIQVLVCCYLRKHVWVFFKFSKKPVLFLILCDGGLYQLLYIATYLCIYKCVVLISILV